MDNAEFVALAVAAISVAGCSSEVEPETKSPRIVNVVEVRSETVEQAFSQIGEFRYYHNTALSFRLGTS